MNTSMNLSRLFIYSALTFFCLVYLMPLFVMVITSFKTLPDIKAGNLMSLPTEWVSTHGVKPGAVLVLA